MSRTTTKTEQKALEINLDEHIYGTFAEIGAGQEVARYFFQVGGAAGTIAKTMSAYDKVYSDKIYGSEPSGRYVCESRIYKMLDHEYSLMQERLHNHKKGTRFFVFANSISAINYQKTNKGEGWLGVRFQIDPEGEPNDIVIHVKMLDNDNWLQQQAIGVLGVNLLYACFRHFESADDFISSLVDHIQGRVSIDMIRATGPDCENVDDRILSLKLVDKGLTDVAIFGPDKCNLHASEFLYKKHIMIVRGSYRPLTKVNYDMLKKGFQQFKDENNLRDDEANLLAEITLDNLKDNQELDEKDFVDRMDILCALGQTVIISNCTNHAKLISYFTDYKPKKIGLMLGVLVLQNILQRLFEKNKDGRLLSAFGEVFISRVQLYIYPSRNNQTRELINCDNIDIPEQIRFLYRHLRECNQIKDISDYDPDILHIFSKEVLSMIRLGIPGWENMVPVPVLKEINNNNLFGFRNTIKVN
ncbi:MAG: TonB-dependent receptor [Bacteroidia bacterium]|nr:TonB-dependent receptor [Bacteroidia bacterium]